MRDCELYCRMGAKTSTPNPLLVHDQHVKMLVQLKLNFHIGIGPIVLKVGLQPFSSDP